MPDSPGPDPSSAPLSLPKHIQYIAVDGVIGAGKTTLANHLAKRFGGHCVLEAFEENPFLAAFYTDPDRWAFHTQLSFLASRFRQQKALLNRDLFRQLVVSDYTFDKDRIFAHLTLQGDERALYESLYTMVEPSIPQPDLVVYLQSTPERLMQNIAKRGRSYERHITDTYIDSLVDAYDFYFFRYTKSPLLIVNAARIDFVKNPEEMEDLVRQISSVRNTGTTYYTPTIEDPLTDTPEEKPNPARR